MQARERGLPGLACALAAVTALAVPAAAGATVRFASPSGLPTGPCMTQATACDLQRAVEMVAVVGDEVIVLPGAYNEGSNDLVVGQSKYVHGAVGQAFPSLAFTSPATEGVSVSGNALLERLSVSITGSSPAAVRLSGGTGQQLVADQLDPGSAACILDGDAVLRDSVCWGRSTGGSGLTALADGAPVIATLRNVTAVGTAGTSVGVLANGDNGGDLQVDAKNVIARGTPPGADVEASALDASSNATVTLESSNYASESEAMLGGTQSVTNPGTGSNQTASPAFVNAALGDFHQLPGSPTVDAGVSAFQLGAFDVDGDPRQVDGTAGCLAGVERPDIGADELIPPWLDCFSPETGITGGPKSKTRKHRAGFVFVATEPATYQCSLDKKPFVPCMPPRVYRKLKTGKHLFAVRAVDSAGNLDISPAERTWRIVKKKKKKKRRKR